MGRRGGDDEDDDDDEDVTATKTSSCFLSLRALVGWWHQ